MIFKLFFISSYYRNSSN